MDRASGVSPSRAARPWAALALGALLAAGCAPTVRAWPDGVRRSEGRLSRDGREHGLWTYWYPNGALRERGRYERGLRVGTWEQWYATGIRRSVGPRTWDPHAAASVREGLWTFWHENGEREARGVFRRGAREGRWDYQRDDGGFDAARSGEYHEDVLLLP